MSIYMILLIIVLCTAGLASYFYHKTVDELNDEREEVLKVENEDVYKTKL